MVNLFGYVSVKLIFFWIDDVNALHGLMAVNFMILHLREMFRVYIA